MNSPSKRPLTYFLAAAASFVLLLLPQLTLELRLDELSSFWVVRDSFRDVIQRSVYIQGQSPLYYLILWTFTHAFGFSAFALRLFSILCSLLSCLLMYRLGTLLFNRDVGRYSVVGLVCSSQFIQSATDARPYALAIVLLLASSISLIEWSRTLRTRWMVAYALLSAGTLYAHYLFGGVLAIHALWLVLTFLRGDRDHRIRLARQTAGLLLLLTVLLAPSVYQLSRLGARGAGLSFMPEPSWWALAKAVFPGDSLLLLALVSAFYLTVWARSRGSFLPLSKEDGMSFLAAWIVLPPVLVFLVSRLSGHPVFVQRYYSGQVIGIALFAGVVLSMIRSREQRQAVVLSLVLVTALSQYVHRTTLRAAEGWRAAIETIASEDRSRECPVLLFSGFIESQTLEWLSDEIVSDFIRAPASYYRLSNKTMLLPYSFDSADAKHYFTSVLAPGLEKHRCVWLLYRNAKLYVAKKEVSPPVSFLGEELRKKGFATPKLVRFGLVELMQYRRAGQDAADVH